MDVSIRFTRKDQTLMPHSHTGRITHVTLIITMIVVFFGIRSQPAVAQDKQYVADSGFRPAANGFGFENYGNADVKQNLTPAEVKRMFGDQVCGASGAKCILTPPAQEWMDETNKAM